MYTYIYLFIIDIIIHIKYIDIIYRTYIKNHGDNFYIFFKNQFLRIINIKYKNNNETKY